MAVNTARRISMYRCIWQYVGHILLHLGPNMPVICIGGNMPVICIGGNMPDQKMYVWDIATWAELDILTICSLFYWNMQNTWHVIAVRSMPEHIEIILPNISTNIWTKCIFPHNISTNIWPKWIFPHNISTNFLTKCIYPHNIWTNIWTKCIFPHNISTTAAALWTLLLFARNDSFLWKKTKQILFNSAERTLDFLSFIMCSTGIVFSPCDS